MLKKVAVIVGMLVAGIVLVVIVQPSEFRISRSTLVAAPPARVFAHVNDLHAWEAWSPWAKRDPEMQKTYDGAPAGVGAIYAWSGNAEVGEGRTTITESRPPDLVRLKLEFKKPFEATNAVEFTFVPEGERTKVTWAMQGTNGFMGKAIGLVMDMDAMVGGDFDQGLAALRGVVEAAAPR